MKLLVIGMAPNPRRVRIFLAEKGLTVPTEDYDIMARQHLTEAFRAVNPLQRLPVLILDDGTALAESVAICRYFEEVRPEPPLFGVAARGRALVEMWNRRVELELFNAVAAVFRHLHPAMAGFEQPQVPQWGEANRAKVAERLAWLDAELAGRRFLAGEDFSIADITGVVAVDFMKPAKLAVPEALVHLRRWHAEVSARPSVAAAPVFGARA